MTPLSMPIALCSTLATGARQLVVHEAFEMMWWFSGSYASSLTPSTSVTSGSVAGAEMMTFLAPASRCLVAPSRLVKKPVDSTTTSTPRSLQGSAAGSRSEKTFSSLPSMIRLFSVCSTVPGKRPRMESYFTSCASVAVSVMSLTATQSMSAPAACAARKRFLPIRPNPLIPACTAIGSSFRVSPGLGPERADVGDFGTLIAFPCLPCTNPDAWRHHEATFHTDVGLRGDHRLRDCRYGGACGRRQRRQQRHADRAAM